jgi:hypothetical protein
MKFGKAYKEVASRVLGCNLSSYYAWDKQGRPIIKLLQKYFPNKEDLQEWLDKSEISKYELLKGEEAVFIYSRERYLSIFTSPLGSLGDTINKDFMDFYFNVLVFAKDKIEDQAIFEPFDIQRSSLLYSTKNNFTYTPPENEIIPKFEVGLERLGQFDCYTNQFLYSNLMQEFNPMIQIDMDHLDLDQKVEAYLHAMLFNLYHTHTDKNSKEKRELFIEIVETLYLSVQKVNQKEGLESAPILNLSADDISLDQLLKKDFKLVQKEFDKILQSIEVA